MAEKSTFSFKSELTNLRKNGTNIAVMVGVAVIIIMMLVPLPAFLLDFLMAINLTFGILIILIVLMNRRAIDFSIFPQLLLISTIFGLALNISSTRMILQKGRDFDGTVVKAFANFVVGGNDDGMTSMVIGVIIFIILVAVQFFVITKGATRVSEVAARFTLDALPGKQMAIDQEYAQGLIGEEEAKVKKRDLQKESDFYGAMDGATKFVSGNVKVGLLITAINIIGGLVIGMMKGYAITEALEVYVILTVGDGLVSQFPALFINIATGLIVTRAISNDTFGGEAREQFSSHTLVYYVAGAFLILMGMIKGFSILIFGPIGVVLIYSGYSLSKKKILKDAADVVKAEKEQEPVEAAETPAVSPPDTLAIELGYGLIPLVDQDKGADLLDRITKIRKEIALDLGLVVPKIRIVDNMDLEPTVYCIKIKGVESGRGSIERGRFLAIDSGMVMDKIEGEPAVDPTFGLPAIWIREDQRASAERNGYTVVDGPSIIVTHLSEIIKENAEELIGRQNILEILDALKGSYSAVVEEVKKVLSMGEIQKVLQSLLREGISIRNMVPILETLADFAVVSKDIGFLSEKVRQRLKKQIVRPWVDGEKQLQVITLHPSIEQILKETAVETVNGLMPGMDPATKSRILNALTNQVYQVQQQGIVPVILTSEVVRRLFRQLTSRELPQLQIFSVPEVPDDVRILTLGEVDIEMERAAV